MDVIFGDVNPSGKLVYTVAKTLEDYNGEICGCCDCDYTEGLYTDYRHFDQMGIKPRYEFGYGLCRCSISVGEVLANDMSPSTSVHRIHVRQSFRGQDSERRCPNGIIRER